MKPLSDNLVINLVEWSQIENIIVANIAAKMAADVQRRIVDVIIRQQLFDGGDPNVGGEVLDVG